MADEEEEFEVLDLTAANRNRYIEQFLGDVTRQSAAKQVVIGGAAGCASGLLLVRAGKTAAISVGVALLTVRIAQHQGYIQINWNRVNKEMERARRRVQQEANRQCPNIVTNIAQHKGYLQNKWNRVKKEMEQARRRVQHKASRQYPNIATNVAQHQGYIQNKWNRVEKEMERARRWVQQKTNRQDPNIATNLRRFAQNNMFLAGGFAVGFLIGVTF